jgi:hypothetical protein
MIAFATPIWSGAARGSGSRVLGVLATTVEANRFDVLRLETGGEEAEEMVVLIDLREDWLEAEAQRGLILHHQHLAQSQQGRSRRSDPLRIDEQTVDRLEKLWEQANRRARNARASETADAGDLLLRAYIDPLGSQWTAALAPVVISDAAEADDEQEDQRLRWGIIVQRRLGDR